MFNRMQRHFNVGLGQLSDPSGPRTGTIDEIFTSDNAEVRVHTRYLAVFLMDLIYCAVLEDFDTYIVGKKLKRKGSEWKFTLLLCFQRYRSTSFEGICHSITRNPQTSLQIAHIYYRTFF